MTVTRLDEVTSIPSEGFIFDAPHVSENSQERVSVRNVYIGEDDFASPTSKVLKKNATLTDYRSACLNRYLLRYPSDAKVEPLDEMERFPKANTSDKKIKSNLDENTTNTNGKELAAEPALTGLYQAMGLSREAAKRISKFENVLDKRWYVFKLNYNSVKDLETLHIPDCDIFIPQVKKQVKIKGMKQIVNEPFLSHFFFAFTTRRIAEIIHESSYVKHARIYYDPFRTDRLTGHDAPMTIPHVQMLDFMLIAEAKSFDIKILDPDKVKIPQGTLVEVTDGPFRGVQGCLTHVGGKQRVVSDSGFCVIATGYVSSYGYKVIDKK